MIPKIALLTAIGTVPILAVQTITSVVTTDVDTTTSDLTRTITGGNVTYSGVETRITTLTAAMITYVPLTVSAVATTRRANLGVNNTSTIWNHNNLADGETGARTVAGAYSSSMETVFSNNNLRSGTENLFVNTSASPGDSLNNVERMDFVFSSGFTPSASLAFTVFERGRGGSGNGNNGGFRIAAITTVSGTGFHTYAPTIVVVPFNSYDNGGAGIGLSRRYDVYTGPVGFDLNTRFNDNIGPQGLAGVLVGLNEFGTNSTIFGYSILPSDVTTNNAANLSNWNNPAFFPTNSGTSNDVDLVASGAQILQVIPEPSSMLLAGLGFLVLARRRR